MLQSDEVIDVLMKLGLSFLQAKTYFNLAKLGTAEAKDISKNSSIARQDIYRIMPTLQNLGLVEKVISNPVKFKATPWKKAVSMLLEQKTRQQSELEKRTQSLFENFAEDVSVNPVEEEQKSQFIVTSEKNLFLKKMEKAIDESKICKDVILPLDSFDIMIYYHLPAMKKAVKRGVKFRIITEKTKKKLGNLQGLEQNSKLEIRRISGSIPVSVAIYDYKETNIRISNESFVPSLWTNNSSVVKLAEIYFEDMWKNAETTKHFSLKQN